MKKKHVSLLSLTSLLFLTAFCQEVVSTKMEPGAFAIAGAASLSAIYVDKNDYPVVQKAAVLFQKDIKMVTDKDPVIINSLSAGSKTIIIIGSLDKSELIAHLVKERKINVDKIKGKWETYLLQVIERPFAGVDRALIIAGSDRRGTAYGVFELSQQMGVSPWYWWADVPVKKHKELYIKKGAYKTDAPVVKYRGIFINDEAPALSGWSKEKFGGFNHSFYEKVFELILRLKGNYLWPAMWGSAFNDDDKLNPVMADEYAIVMGTSHHEPMVRAHDEWRRYGSGKWNYDSNAVKLREFWKEGIDRMGTYENIVTLGMRGDGDEPMTEGTAIDLLQRIVKDQREILQKETGKEISSIPQVWALYKEVQDYYDKGMRVPDDVTLMLCDDNWGNIRKLPRRGEKQHSGGYGIYYHFDYVGDPRNYKWLNTNQVERTWEQMNLAWEYGADRIWIVNVGDIKPMEYPISFFLDMAWNPKKWTADNISSYSRLWAARQFGDAHANGIADILTRYTKYNSRRKPELLAPDTYSLLNYKEAETVVADYKKLEKKAELINSQLPDEYKDAFYQLVLFPVKACANLNQMYEAVAKNHLYASRGDARANIMADSVKLLFEKDSLLTLYYNTVLAGGKWNHLMDQTHIGYTYWQQPPYNTMPEVKRIDINGKAAENRNDGKVSKNATATIGENEGQGFNKGYISIEAPHFTRAINAAGVKWKVIPDLGRTLGGVTVYPANTASVMPVGSPAMLKAIPRLEYGLMVADTGWIKIHAYLSPTLNFHNTEGLRFGISVDDENPQIINMHADKSDDAWRKWVADNINIQVSEHYIKKKGNHVLKFWMVDPGVVLQKLVVDLGGLKPSYLGPPENIRTATSASSLNSNSTATKQAATAFRPLGVQKGLKDYYKDYFSIGVAVNLRSLKGADSALIIQQFNSITPENAMKMGPLHPKENEYYWKDADAIVDFAQKHGLLVRGHNLLWHEQAPDWMFKDEQGNLVSKEVLLKRLKDHITTVMQRYKGKIYAWDVVNEAIEDDSAKFLRNSLWYQICGDEFISKAFEYAREADPDALLFYNDYNTERPEKRERVYKLLKQLVDAKVPIDGVGLQAHWSLFEPTEKNLRDAIEKYASLSLKLQFTELDISVYPWEKFKRARKEGESDVFTAELEQQQAMQYKMVFDIFREYKKVITGVTFWNVSDNYTWLDHYPVEGRKNYPLLFDVNRKPKKAYREVVKGLE